MAAEEGTCRLQVGDGCHQPKKNRMICKYCWDNGTTDQKEMLKAWQSGYCAHRGCFEWQKPSSQYCIERDQCQISAGRITESTMETVGSIQVKAEDTERAEAAEARLDRGRERIAATGSSSARSRSPNPDKMTKLAAKLKKLSTPELKVLTDNCIQELYERANVTF